MFNQLTPVVKNIIIINVLMYLACAVVPGLQELSSGYYWQSENFRPWQLITHMFTHAPLRSGNLMHIFFNMYALFLFGSAIERQWGAKRFLIYYFICGLGAFFLHEFINYIEIQRLIGLMNPEDVRMVYEEGAEVIRNGKNYIDAAPGQLNYSLNVPVVGASGCVFGVLLAFGMLFPNTELMLLFPPIALKAKWLVIIYGAIELLLALQNNPGDNVAHYAHIGGMIFGYIMLKIWQKRDGSYYGNRFRY